MTVILLPLFFWQLPWIPSTSPFEQFSGGQTISAFQGISENVSKDVCTAVKIGADVGLCFSTVRWEVWQTHTTISRDLHYLAGGDVTLVYQGLLLCEDKPLEAVGGA